MGGDALLRLGLADKNGAVGERQRRRLAEKGRRDHLSAGVEGAECWVSDVVV